VRDRNSIAQQTATTAVRLEPGSDDDLDGTIGFDGTRSRGVGHRDELLFFSRQRAARYRNGDKRQLRGPTVLARNPTDGRQAPVRKPK